MGETESENTGAVEGDTTLEPEVETGEGTTGDAGSKGVEGEATQQVGDDVQEDAEDR